MYCSRSEKNEIAVKAEKENHTKTPSSLPEQGQDPLTVAFFINKVTNITLFIRKKRTFEECL
jgi:hypothetical protein